MPICAAKPAVPSSLSVKAAAGPAIELDDAEDLVAERDRHAQHRTQAHHQQRIGAGGLPSLPASMITRPSRRASACFISAL
jgi:hypothetical protein